MNLSTACSLCPFTVIIIGSFWGFKVLAGTLSKPFLCWFWDHSLHRIIFTLATDFPYMDHFRLTGFINRWRSVDRATLSLSDVTDKQTSWLVNVTFDWRQVMTTAVQRYGLTRCFITFLRRVFCTINIESSQLIHRNDLKIKLKYKS